MKIEKIWTFGEYKNVKLSNGDNTIYVRRKKDLVFKVDNKYWSAVEFFKVFKKDGKFINERLDVPVLSEEQKKEILQSLL